MATANDMDLTQNGIINNVHIPSSPSRFVITDEFIYDNQLSRLCVPSDTTLNSPSKRTLRNLRLKTYKKRLIDDDGFQIPDKRHTSKKIGKKNPSLFFTTSQTSNPAQAPPPPAESRDSEIEDEDTGKSNPTAVGTPQNRIPPIFVNPPDNWCTLISIARQLAPTLISKLTGKFLRITVQSDDEYRKLVQFLRHEGVEYKSFMLKSDRPIKLLSRGLPTSTKVEEIRVEIEREGFQIHKISRLQKFKTKAPMPLIYLQLVNDAKTDTIFQFTEMFGTQISFKRYDNSRNKRPNQCWRCQGLFHSSEVCHLPIKCLKCTWPHVAKNCNRAFEDPLICANCGGEHAANWRQCPVFRRLKIIKKAPQKGNQNKNQHPKRNNPNNLSQNKTQERNLGSLVPGQIREISHVNTPNSNFPTIFANVIQIANDKAVDEELLARVFRAALPALRKLSHPDDKACEIFQAYVALKNGQIKLEPGQDPLIANYHLYKDDRVIVPRIRTSGGTTIYCKNNFVQSRDPLLGIQYKDATAIENKMNNFPPLRVVSAYARFCAEINRKFPEKDFLKILNSGNILINPGDLNTAHKMWNNNRSNNFGFRLKRIIQNFPNARIVAAYTLTHINSRSRPGVRDSIIDLAVFKNIPFNYDIRVIDDICSDHLPVILTLYTNSDTMKIPAQLSANWENFPFLLKNKPLPIPASPSNEHLDIAIGRLGENISEALVAASKPKFKTAPIKLPSDIRSKVHHRNRVWRFWQRSRDPALKNELRTISN
ncbi:RNA-directed DNA polymerase from mobile element jockey [Trichonephila clavipes]|nr:RNA-directed DNA polymerase from mobile element jockey [Trichonephila clavipes]